MKTTIEKDRLQLIEQLKKHIGDRPLFYLKFCSCEKYANDVCMGNLYANTPKYFRQQEIEKGERGQGDRFELISNVEIGKTLMFDAETEELLLDVPNGNLRMRYEDDDAKSLISFVGIKLEDMKFICADEKNAVFKFPFSDVEYASMEENFGKYCVIIEGREIERCVRKYADIADCEYLFDSIEYCSQQNISRIQTFIDGDKKRFLYKNSDLAYQREYRLVFAHEIPDDHFIRIGMLNNSKIIDAKKLKEMCFSICYTSHLKSDGK